MHCQVRAANAHSADIKATPDGGSVLHQISRYSRTHIATCESRCVGMPEGVIDLVWDPPELDSRERSVGLCSGERSGFVESPTRVP